MSDGTLYRCPDCGDRWPSDMLQGKGCPACELTKTAQEDGLYDCCPECGASLAECHIGDAACPECGKVVPDASPHSATKYYDLTNPEGRDAYALDNMALGMHLVLWHLRNELFGVLDGDHPQVAQICAQNWLDRLNALMDEHNVTLEV